MDNAINTALKEKKRVYIPNVGKEILINSSIVMDDDCVLIVDENQVIAKRESIKNDFLERAKKRISINQESAQKKADASLKLIEERDSAVIRRLDSVYETNCDKWVDEIVARVIDG